MKNYIVLVCGIVVILLVGAMWYAKGRMKSEAIYTNTTYGYSVHYPKSLLLDAKDPKVVTLGVVSFEPGPGALFMSVDEGEILPASAELQDQTESICQEMVLAGAPAVRCAGSEGFAGGSTTSYMVQLGKNLLSFYYIHGDTSSDNRMEAIISSLEIQK